MALHSYDQKTIVIQKMLGPHMWEALCLALRSEKCKTTVLVIKSFKDMFPRHHMNQFCSAIRRNKSLETVGE